MTDNHSDMRDAWLCFETYVPIYTLKGSVFGSLKSSHLKTRRSAAALFILPTACDLSICLLWDHSSQIKCCRSLLTAFHLTWAECLGGLSEGRCSHWLGETNLWETMAPVSRCSMTPLCREFSDWKSDTRASRLNFFFECIHLLCQPQTLTQVTLMELSQYSCLWMICFVIWYF